MIRSIWFDDSVIHVRIGNGPVVSYRPSDRDYAVLRDELMGVHGGLPATITEQPIPEPQIEPAVPDLEPPTEETIG